MSFNARLLAACLLAGLSLTCTRALVAQPLTNTPGFIEQRVTPDDGVGNDGFGYGAAISGTVAMIGEAHATINGSEARGEVYVYGQFGRQWILTQKLLADDGMADDEFGFSIAIEGDTAIIGARSGNGSRGAVYIFTNFGGVWAQTQKLTARDGQGLDWFGYSVALSGTRLVVGARNARGDRGAAYFYDGSTGNWILTAELSPGDLQPQDYFGNSVTISGTTALVGAFDINGHTPGSAYIFVNGGDSWAQTQKLTPSDGQPDDWFGFAVSLDGATAAIGASTARVNGQIHQGAVYIFNRTAGIWRQGPKLLATDGAAFALFGWSLKLRGDDLLCGATGADKTYIFVRSRGLWRQTAQLTANNAETGVSYGWTVDISKSTALITAPFSHVNGNTEGAAYFYTQLTASDG